jgi:polyhydroxybutyrate depolymerase
LPGLKKIKRIFLKVLTNRFLKKNVYGDIELINYMKYLPLNFSFLFVLTAITAFAQPSQKREQMTVDGIERAFVTYIPTIENKDHQMPLIISLHGGLATPKGQFRLADFRPIAEREKVLIVCPASKKIWHDGNDNKGIDDVKFIDHLITYMIKTYHADPKRVYIAGISNGGFLASRLACQLSKRIAAIGVVAATMDEGEGYAPVKAMPVMYIHGTKDPVFSPKGGKAFGRTTYSHRQVLQVWVDKDKCNSKPVVTTIADNAGDGTSIIKEEYTNHSTGVKVIGYSIVNGGHTWPGGSQSCRNSSSAKLPKT